MCKKNTFKDQRLIIASQMLSVFAVAISFSWFVTFLLGMATMMGYQLYCCARPTKPFLFALSLVSLVEAMFLIYAGVDLLNNQTPDFCWPFLSLEMTCNDVRTLYAALSFCSAILWVAAAGVTMIFVTSGKYDEALDSETPDDSKIPDVEHAESKTLDA